MPDDESVPAGGSPDPLVHRAPHDPALLAAARDAARRGVMVTAAETDRAWQALSARLALPTATTVSPPPPRATAPGGTRRRATLWRGIAWAAMAATALVVIRTVRTRAEPRAVEVSAPLGQRVAVQLPDGSQLVLAAGSRARWSEGFRGDAREVFLTGEGYFEVVHDPTRAFRVHAGAGVVTDLGTRFLVRAWPELPALDVHVLQGIVTVGDSGRVRREGSTAAVRLTEGRRGQLDAAGVVRISPADSAAIGWMAGILRFDDVPLREALPVLSRWYGVPLRADNALLERRLTGQFVQQSLPRMVEALALALAARAQPDGAGYVLVP